jgi:hypothetical protein
MATKRELASQLDAINAAINEFLRRMASEGRCYSSSELEHLADQRERMGALAESYWRREPKVRGGRLVAQSRRRKNRALVTDLEAARAKGASLSTAIEQLLRREDPAFDAAPQDVRCKRVEAAARRYRRTKSGQ